MKIRDIILLVAIFVISLYISSGKIGQKPSAHKTKLTVNTELGVTPDAKIIDEGSIHTTVRRNDLKNSIQNEYDQINSLIKYQGIESQLSQENLEESIRLKYFDLLQKRQQVFNRLVQMQIEETQNLLSEVQ